MLQSQLLCASDGSTCAAASTSGDASDSDPGSGDSGGGGGGATVDVVYLGGTFTTYDGTASVRYVALNPATGAILQTTNGTGFAQTVESIVPLGDGTGRVYAGGLFADYNGGGGFGVARLNSDGTRDTTFAVGTGFNNTVNEIALATDGSGDLYATGAFTNFDGAATSRAGRINSDGTKDTAFTGAPTFTANALAPATDGSGDVYFGGGFTFISGMASNYIARLNSDGTYDTGFNVGTGIDNSVVRTVAVATDGTNDVYVGGLFATYNGNASANLVRINSDGSFDAGFSTGTGPNQLVWDITPANDGSGDVYIGGNFTDYNGTPINRIARINSDGSLDTGFNPGTGADNDVLVIQVVPDGSGDIFVGGQFANFDGTATSRIIRLNSDGSRDTGFVVGTGAVGDVEAIAF